MSEQAKILVVEDEVVGADHARIGSRGLDVAAVGDAPLVLRRHSPQARGGQAAVEAYGRLRPDVVLMDIQMPGCDGIEATRSIKARWPQVRVIALTARSTYQAAALSAGADRFLLKGTPTADLVAAIADGRTVRDNGPGGDNGADLPFFHGKDEIDI